MKMSSEKLFAFSPLLMLTLMILNLALKKTNYSKIILSHNLTLCIRTTFPTSITQRRGGGQPNKTDNSRNQLMNLELKIGKESSKQLSVNELKSAAIKLIKLSQRAWFTHEIDQIQKRRAVLQLSQILQLSSWKTHQDQYRT